MAAPSIQNVMDGIGARLATISGLRVANYVPDQVNPPQAVVDFPGEIDYRLARNMVVSEFRKGRLSRLDVCDAHPELLRAARNVGEPAIQDCPVCEQEVGR